MKKLLSVLMVVLMVALVVAPTVSASAATCPAVTFVAKDSNTGKVMSNVSIVIMRVTKSAKTGETTTKTITTVKTDSKGCTKVLSLGAGNYKWKITKAPSGYATKTTGTFVLTQPTAKGTRSTVKQVAVKVNPLFTAKIKVVDGKGKVVPNAFVDICSGQRSASGYTDSKGIISLKNVMYGSNHVLIQVTKGNKEYIAYDKSLTLKAGAKGTLSKTIKLPAQSEWQLIRQYGGGTLCYKPMIYVYSNTEQEVNVKLGKPENLTVSYPEYPEDGWKVTAHTDGLLTDSSTGRGLYGLYWEGKNRELAIQDTGFVVAREDVVDFLEEKLAYLGLNELEAEEFIVYWLPKLQANEYNYIRFATAEEIEETMPLETAPAADAVIRVWMEYAALDEKIDIDEQPLDQIVRADLNDAGLLVVEWGGSDF